MTDTRELLERNEAFRATEFAPDLTINPSGNMMVIACVDPRVDPTRVLGIRHGEAAVIRNVGGRVTPATFATMALLSKVGQANSETRVAGVWNLVVLHHTDCGMTDLAAYPHLLAEYFEVDVQEVEAKGVSDPRVSAQVDVALLRATLRGSDFLVSGLVYDVSTGRLDVVVPPGPLLRE